jgi:hypothetical protein
MMNIFAGIKREHPPDPHHIRIYTDPLKPYRCWIASFLFFAIFSFAYGTLSPSFFRQPWESLMYAYWAELYGIRSIQGNHPLGHFILNSLYVIATSIGYQGKALPVHIVANSIFGGLTVALFFFLIHNLLKISFLDSLGITIIFGASYILWLFSGSAEIYTFSTLMLLLAWISLINELFHYNRRLLFGSGIFAGLSILSHQLSAVFLFVGFVMIVMDRNEYRTRLVSFFGTAVLIAAAGHLFLGYIATSSFSIQDIYQWIRGYVGDPIFGNNLTLENIPIAWMKAWATLTVPTFGRSRFARLLIHSILLGIVVFGLSNIKVLDKKKQIIAISAFLQCCITWLLIMWFTPHNPGFWLLTFVPWMILFSVCIEVVRVRLTHWLVKPVQVQYILSSLLILIGVAVIAFNLKYAIIGNHQIDELSQESFNIWLQHSEPDDMLITSGDLISQLIFWGNRPNTVDLYDYFKVTKNSDDRFEFLRKKMNQTLCNGKKVIVAPAIVDNYNPTFLLWLDLSRDDLHKFIDGLPKEQYFSYKNINSRRDTQVYSILSPATCDA